MHRRDLPPDLPEAFTPATARAFGVTRSRLRASDLERPFRGVSSVRAADDDVPPAVERLVAQFATIMAGHEYFSHQTAAALWGLPLPRWAASSTRLHVSVPRPARAPRARGVLGHQADPRLVSVVRHPSGVRVTSPASTWAQLATVLTETELVAVGDALVREPRRPGDRPALATIAELGAMMIAGRRPGIRLLRQAHPRIRLRVDSPRESALRVLLVDAGLPEPEPGFAVIVGGRTIAHVDLAYPRSRVALEYEGEHHRVDPDQWAYDIRRYDALTDAGWRVIRVTKTDLSARHAHLIRRVRAALG